MTPKRVPTKGMSQAEMFQLGRRTTVRPLLYTWSTRLVMAVRPMTKVRSKKFGQPTSEMAASSIYFKLFQQRLAETEGRAGNRIGSPSRVIPLVRRLARPWTVTTRLPIAFLWRSAPRLPGCPSQASSAAAARGQPL
jgi:hypothetical protein